MENALETTTIIFTILAAYLIGSIPFGLVLVRLAGGEDIREQGSGNIGATNVVRVKGKFLGFLTLTLDAGKGAFAVWITALLEPEWWVLGGVASVIGHVFPFWLHFKGGKGVATTMAVILMFYWPLGVLTCVSWVIAFGVTRYSSIAALASMGITAISSFYVTSGMMKPAIIVLCFLVIVRHHSNIMRLLKGNEPSFNN